MKFSKGDKVKYAVNILDTDIVSAANIGDIGTVERVYVNERTKTNSYDIALDNKWGLFYFEEEELEVVE